MLWATIASFIDGLATISWKKAMGYNNLWTLVFFWFASFAGALTGTVLLLGWWMRLPWEVELQWLMLLWITIVLYAMQSVLLSKAYALEKISTLQPYDKINALIALMWGFIIFQEWSTLALYCGIACILVTLIYGFYSSWVNHARLSKWVLLCVLWRCCGGALLLVIASLMVYMSPLEQQTYLATFIFFAMAVYMLFFYQSFWFGFLKKNPPKFYMYRGGASFWWYANRIIIVFLIANVWIVMTSLLSFLSLIVLLLCSFFAFKDIPKLSDVIVALVTLSLVLVGRLF